MMPMPFFSAAPASRGFRKWLDNILQIGYHKVISRDYLVFGFDDTRENRCPSLQVEMTCSGSGDPERQIARAIPNDRQLG